MNDPQNSQLLREQIRIKNSELKKLQVERDKQEEKVLFLQDFTQNRIKTLQSKIEELEEEIRYHQSRRSNLKTSSEKPLETTDEISDRKEQKERYLKTLQFLKELKTKNDRLGLRLDHEKKERDRLTREKGVLAKEIRRMRENPSTKIAPEFRSDIKSIESRMEEARLRYEHLLKEKDMLIAGYEAAIKAATESGEASPSAIKTLAENLSALKNEKLTLENTLKLERKKHANMLTRKLAQLEEEITQNLKRKLNRKKLHGNSAADEEVNMGDGWITTYADLATLLMTFFILYYSLGQMNMNQIQDMVEKGKPPEELQSLIKAQHEPKSLEEAIGLKEDLIVEDLKKLEDQISKDSPIEVEADRNQIVLKLPGETLFPSGSADLDLKRSRKTLEEIVKVAKKYPKYKIQIKGHTDDVPIDSERFPTNWELSAARASAVLRYFLDKNVAATRLAASGYADTFPLADNTSELGRKLNRRVEIVLEKEK